MPSLQQFFSCLLLQENQQTYALLSTLDLHRVQYGNSGTVLWHHWAPTTYWSRPLWIIPIHCRTQQHWVLAVVSVEEKLIFVYDSFAELNAWESDLEDIMTLISKMMLLASQHEHPISTKDPQGSWETYPLFQGSPQQHNTHDCGVWVLCMIAAILRGFSGVSIQEGQMPQVRQLFAQLLYRFPEYARRR
ncbi:hypothetical protein HMN09_00027200 [Mycena chlorophos]|uniref:Ubiquitin-like protease family profile domain-containing protein n=1 Tax=Mycena chlorophos TaxID=658473 RepID=A0A8H6WPM5_MYCCL|nr:hypothetical protein HMN09_00027200 [Mycena chlorophos]